MNVTGAGIGKAYWDNFSMMGDTKRVDGVILVNARPERASIGECVAWWELRRLFVFLGIKSANHGDYKAISNQCRRTWNEDVSRLGLDWEEHLHFTYKSGTMKGKLKDDCTAEWEISTVLFFRLVLFQTYDARYSTHRTHASNLLRGILLSFPQR